MRLHQVLQRRRDLLVERLSSIPGLHVTGPEAGMFVVADVRGTGLDSAGFARRLYDEQGVSVLDASAFGPSATGHIRLSYTEDEARLEEACRRISAFCSAAGAVDRGERAHA